MDKLIRGRLIATTKMPYMSSLIYNLIPCPIKQVPTAAVSRSMRLYYNEEFIESLTEEEVAFIIAHEALHIFYDHHDRGKGFDHNLFNVAADIEINDDLYFAGLPLPTWGDSKNPTTVLHFANYNLPPHKTAEWYYSRVPKNLKAQCGSGAGNPFDWEDDTGGRCSSEINRIRREAAGDIVKHKGDLPGEMRRMAEDMILPPKVDWRTKFRSCFKQQVTRVKGAFDYTYSTPSNRRTSPNFIFPSMFAYSPKVGIIIDTSGSMSKKELGLGLSETKHVISSTGIKDIYLAIIDARLYSCSKIKNHSEIKAKLVGGGGSVLTPAFDELKKHKCSIVIVVTDGEIDYPDKEIVGSKTIWLLTTEKTMRFGEHVYLDVGEAE